MAPGTNTGAAHPVFPFGVEDETMLEKVTNDALANLRAIVKEQELGGARSRVPAH